MRIMGSAASELLELLVLFRVVSWTRLPKQTTKKHEKTLTRNSSCKSFWFRGSGFEIIHHSPFSVHWFLLTTLQRCAIYETVRCTVQSSMFKVQGPKPPIHEFRITIYESRFHAISVSNSFISAQNAMFAPPARHPVHRAMWRKYQGFGEKPGAINSLAKWVPDSLYSFKLDA